MTRQELEQQALDLPPAERQKLAQRLWESVATDFSYELDETIVAEWERRYQEMKTGKVQGIPAEQVHTEIRREFGWNK